MVRYPHQVMFTHAVKAAGTDLKERGELIKQELAWKSVRSLLRKVTLNAEGSLT